MQRARQPPAQVKIETIGQRMHDRKILDHRRARLGLRVRADQSDTGRPRRDRRRTCGRKRRLSRRMSRQAGLQPICAASSSQKGVYSTRYRAALDRAEEMRAEARPIAQSIPASPCAGSAIRAALNQREPARLQFGERRDRAEGGAQESDEAEAGADLRMKRVQKARRRRRRTSRNGSPRIEPVQKMTTSGLEGGTVGGNDAWPFETRDPGRRRHFPVAIARTNSSVLVPNCSFTVPPDS